MATLEITDFKEFRELEGKPFPPGEWVTITQEMIDDFARATGDFQWIHTDPEKAALHSPYKKTVAHGFLSVSLLSRLLGDCIEVRSVKLGLNYGLNKVRFPAPLPVDSQVRLKGLVKQIEAYPKNGLKITWDCMVEIKGVAKPACVAEFVTLMFE
jgi:acyl dehydratase